MATKCLPEPMATYPQLFNSVVDLVIDYKDSYSTGRNLTYRENPVIPFSAVDYGFIIFFITIFMFIKFILTEAVARRYTNRLMGKRFTKFKEFIFHGSVYTAFTFISLYLMIFNNNQSCQPFRTPTTMWKDAADAYIYQTFNWPTYLMTIGNLSYYVFAFWAILFVDPPRKDTNIYICHHIISFLLASYGYAVRAYTFILMTMFLHAIAPMFLEIARATAMIGWINTSLTMFFLTFITWFASRLYVFPKLLMYSITQYPQHVLVINHAFWICVLYVILLGIHLAWTMMLVRFLRFKITAKYYKEIAIDQKIRSEMK